jgi:3-isopropylmalate dehydrogenase
MMLRYTFNLKAEADRVEGAVRKALAQGLRTADIAKPGERKCSTGEMGDAVVKNL